MKDFYRNEDQCVFKTDDKDAWKDWLHCMSYINLIFGRLHDRKFNLLAKFFTTLVTILTIQILIWFYKTSK